jgi:hypothetical protein
MTFVLSFLRMTFVLSFLRMTFVLSFLRMTFGELADDEYQSDMGATRGNIGKGGIGGGIRMAQAGALILLFITLR